MDFMYYDQITNSIRIYFIFVLVCFRIDTTFFGHYFKYLVFTNLLADVITSILFMYKIDSKCFIIYFIYRQKLGT